MQAQEREKIARVDKVTSCNWKLSQLRQKSALEKFCRPINDRAQNNNGYEIS